MFFYLTHLISLDLVTQTIFGEQHRSLSSSLCSFLPSPVTLSLLGPNILLSTLFSNTLSLRSSLNMSDQVSHPYKTTGKIIVLYITFVFTDYGIFSFLCSIYLLLNLNPSVNHRYTIISSNQLKHILLKHIKII